MIYSFSHILYNLFRIFFRNLISGQKKCVFLSWRRIMSVKYVFVTGGVVSGLGKGITAASLGRLLKRT